MQTTTYYVHETTNTRFTFENCGGCLKQIRKKMLGCYISLNITSTNNEYETTNTRFTFENCGGCLKQIRKKSKTKVITLAYIQVQTKLVYEATNVLFAIENRGGALKQN